MQSVQQLDIFTDSRDVMLRNDVLEQLQRRDATAAQTALERLAGDYPDDDTLPAMTVLVHELARGSTAPFADHTALAIVRRHIESEVVPAARRVLSAQDVQRWLAPCWRSLADRAANLAFRGTEADSHAAPLWLRAGDGAVAIDAVEGIESWWRIPAPLAWMTEGRYRIGGLDAVWPLLAELAWLARARFAALLIILGDASLDALRRRFDAEFSGAGEVDDYAWFPAWLLVVKPALAERLGEARVQHGKAGHAQRPCWVRFCAGSTKAISTRLFGLRQTLSYLHPGLFDTYMATRRVQHR
ncbi:hypothetical protein SAMN05446935_8518 [Burkholderia sp. YR290]|nr:hypothetical protein SAMN05446935_8518 [Burkholderia sp. YR290]